MTEVSVYVRPADESDATAIADLAARTFAQTYGSQNQPANMEHYIRRNFSHDLILSELRDRGSYYLLAEASHRAVGYAALRETSPPGIDLDGRTVELARMYVEAARIGEGIGSLLMENGLDLARKLGFDTIWLGVWRHNSRAVAFYRKWGFEVAGTQNFVLGRDVQVDYLLARPLEIPDQSPADSNDWL